LGSGGSRGGQIDLKGGAAATDAGAILFRTGTGTGGTSQTEKARLDASASGRLLVGTSSTSSSLPRLIVSGGADGGTTPAILVANTGATPTDGTALGVYDFSAANHSAAARIIARRDGGTWTAGSSQPTRLEFSTTADGASTPTERFRLEASGNSRFSNGEYVFPNVDNTIELGSGTNRWQAVWAANGTIQTSDQRAKVDIANATLGSDFIKALRPISYKWIEGGKRDTGVRDQDGNWIYESVPGERTHWGFIAQEVKQVVDAAGVDFGGWVLTDKDDPDSQQALRYDQFIAPLTKALQEALAEIDALKAKVAALEAA
jgi:hypothetical protein